MTENPTPDTPQNRAALEADASPFPVPPLETHEKGSIRPERFAMEHDRAEAERLTDPGASPFDLPPIEGLPYAKGSEEDRAVRRVMEESERERAAIGADR